LTPRTSLDDKPQQQSHGVWPRVLRQWHWISSAVCLIGMLVFTITGITLNHAGRIKTTPDAVHHAFTLPAELLDQLPSTQTGPAWTS
jgi:hypothetical protein